MPDPDISSPISIGKLARIIGVCPATIRNWEHEERIPRAQVTVGGHRRFSQIHVEAIQRLMGAAPHA